MNTAAQPRQSALFEEIIAVHALHIPPRFLNDLHAGVRGYLQRWLLRYRRELGGVPLCYGKVELAKDTAALQSSPITYENPCIHITVRVYWTLFSPSPHARLVGTINKTSRDHLGLLVLSYFSATVYAHQLEAAFAWSEERQCWEDRKAGEPLLLGQEIVFEIVELLHDGPVMTIVGSLDRLLVEGGEAPANPAPAKRRKHEPPPGAKKTDS